MQICRYLDGQTDGYVDIWMDGQMDKCFLMSLLSSSLLIAIIMRARWVAISGEKIVKVEAGEWKGEGTNVINAHGQCGKFPGIEESMY